MRVRCWAMPPADQPGTYATDVLPTAWPVAVSDSTPPVVTRAVAEPSPKANRQKHRRGAPKPASGVIGREPKLTDAKVEAIAAKIAEGRSLEVACALNGVSRRAVTYWLAMANDLVERVPGKPKDEVTGEEAEAQSPWPRLPAPLLVRFFRAVTHARAQAEDLRIKRIEELSDGGQVIYERTEVTENPKTGLKRTVTERRLAGRLARPRLLAGPNGPAERAARGGHADGGAAPGGPGRQGHELPGDRPEGLRAGAHARTRSAVAAAGHDRGPGASARAARRAIEAGTGECR
jgi:hypothetical protein